MARELLDRCRYEDIIENGYYVEYIDPVPGHRHIRRLIANTGKFIFLRCLDCGNVRQVINPDYIPYYSKGKLTKLGKDKNKPPEHKLDAVDRRHAKKMLDKYEGNAEADFAQPYLPNGERNPVFIKHHGTKAYENV